LGNKKSKKVQVKSHAAGASPNYLGKQGAEILIGSACLSMEDFCEMVRYVLTNTDLEDDDDPRYGLLAQLSSVSVIAGRNPGRKQLSLP